MSEMAEAIRQLIQEKGYSEDSVKTIIENALKAAYNVPTEQPTTRSSNSTTICRTYPSILEKRSSMACTIR